MQPQAMSEDTQPLQPLPPELRGESAAFDVVALDADGRECRWSMTQFWDLPLLERVRLLASGQLRFYRSGVEIPLRDALRGL